MDRLQDFYDFNREENESKGIKQTLKDEFFKVEGFFKYRVYEGDEIVAYFERKNTIVLQAKEIMASLLGNCGSTSCINEFVIGGDNTVSAETMLNPPRPNISDTNLTFKAYTFTRKRGDTVNGASAFNVSYPQSNIVRFNFIIGKDEANGTGTVAYLSAGIKSGNKFFALQNYPVIAKDNNKLLEFEWDIIF